VARTRTRQKYRNSIKGRRTISAWEKTPNGRAKLRRYWRSPLGAAARRRANLKRLGLTPITWEAMLAEQGHTCAACHATIPGSKNGWHTDHSHDTGVVRGILCQSCNLILGYAKDDPAKLLLLVQYLGRQ
jgi:hypothetical protein